MRLRIEQCFIYLLASLLVFTQTAPAYAGMVGTQSLIQGVSAELERERVLRTLEREEVRQALAAHGLTVEQAKARVNMLTQQEVRQLAAHLDSLPAGGNGLLVLVIVALVVVILELAGVTDIFTGI
jgi:hypothetical protein